MLVPKEESLNEQEEEQRRRRKVSQLKNSVSTRHGDVCKGIGKHYFQDHCKEMARSHLRGGNVSEGAPVKGPYYHQNSLWEEETVQWWRQVGWPA